MFIAFLFSCMYLLTRSCSAVLPQAAGPAFALFAFSFSFNGYHAVDVGLQQEMCDAWKKNLGV